MKVAFVVQRCGLEVNGGAESHCLQTARRMARHWHTEILTTCALDYMTWQNFYPEGVENLGSTVVRRFPVDQPRDVEAFNQFSAELHARQKKASLVDQETWMRAQGPMSMPLLSYLQAHKNSYDLFIFYGYLYATTYFGLPIVAKKAFLAPLAHDEWTIYFSMWEHFFSLPKGFLFNTPAEQGFLHGRFPKNALPGPVVGVGIEPPEKIKVDEFSARYDLTSPFLLYVGRIDESKGCGQMFEYFTRWKKEFGGDHKLVLLGTEVMPVPFDDDIICLGFVDETEKWEALQACDWLVMPSPNESLSMVLLEAWSLQHPVLVNGDCAVLRDQCMRSNAGLWYHSYAEWCVALEETTEQTKHRLGLNGKAFVREHYSWKRIEEAYLHALSPPGVRKN